MNSTSQNNEEEKERCGILVPTLRTFGRVVMTIPLLLGGCRYGFLSPEQSQLIHREVPAVCAELRPHTLHLVDSFGIPQPFLGLIAYDWVESNAWDNVSGGSSQSIV